MGHLHIFLCKNSPPPSPLIMAPLKPRLFWPKKKTRQISIILNYLSLKFPSFHDALRHFWLKLDQLVWRRSINCKKFIDRRTDVWQKVIGKAPLSFQLYLAKTMNFYKTICCSHLFAKAIKIGFYFTESIYFFLFDNSCIYYQLFF